MSRIIRYSVSAVAVAGAIGVFAGPAHAATVRAVATPVQIVRLAPTGGFTINPVHIGPCDNPAV